jgi:hypothetical protein
MAPDEKVIEKLIKKIACENFKNILKYPVQRIHAHWSCLFNSEA